jgi:hypothetical protein
LHPRRPRPQDRSVAAFFRGHRQSRRLFTALHRAVRETGPTSLHVTRSQIAFRHGSAFAWAWMPGKYLRGTVAPLVVSVRLRRRDPSRRWKEVVSRSPGWFMHHLELFDVEDVDEQVRRWLTAARHAVERTRGARVATARRPRKRLTAGSTRPVPRQ